MIRTFLPISCPSCASGCRSSTGCSPRSARSGFIFSTRAAQRRSFSPDSQCRNRRQGIYFWRETAQHNDHRMVPAHRLRSCSARFAVQPSFFSRHTAPALFLGLFLSWTECVPGFPRVDGCSDGGGGGSAEAEEVGPVCYRWIAGPGGGEGRATGGYPGHRARFQQMMETMTASMNARLPEPVPFVFPAWIGLAMAFPVILVILWFLVARRRAFASAAQELAPGASKPTQRFGRNSALQRA